METLMEKDVLTEIVVSRLALISRILDNREYLNHNADCNRLLEIRDLLYSALPQKKDYDSILSECNSIETLQTIRQRH